MDPALKEIARAQSRQILSSSPGFHSMPHGEKLELYKNTVDERYRDLSRQARVQDGVVTYPHAAEVESQQMARPPRRFGPGRASDDIDDARHLNQRIEQAGDLGADFIKELDFPEFVGDLLEAVFDANLKVTIEQMKTYTDLLKSATASLAKYVQDIDEAASFAYLAENQPDDFSFAIDDEGNAKLTDKEGNDKDLGDNEVKAKIMHAKIAMAKEHRALLRETILMGITRLVVEKGTVKAGVIFDIKATEKIKKSDVAQRRFSRQDTKTFGGGFLGFFSGAGTRTTSRSRISVSTASSQAQTDLQAKITGSVEIQFKSDYFKLDNFAEMYAQLREGQQQPAGALPPSNAKS